MSSSDDNAMHNIIRAINDHRITEIFMPDDIGDIVQIFRQQGQEKAYECITDIRNEVNEMPLTQPNPFTEQDVTDIVNALVRLDEKPEAAMQQLEAIRLGINARYNGISVEGYTQQFEAQQRSQANNPLPPPKPFSPYDQFAIFDEHIVNACVEAIRDEDKTRGKEALRMQFDAMQIIYNRALQQAAKDSNVTPKPEIFSDERLEALWEAGKRALQISLSTGMEENWSDFNRIRVEMNDAMYQHILQVAGKGRSREK